MLLDFFIGIVWHFGKHTTLLREKWYHSSLYWKYEVTISSRLDYLIIKHKTGGKLDITHELVNLRGAGRWILLPSNRAKLSVSPFLVFMLSRDNHLLDVSYLMDRCMRGNKLLIQQISVFLKMLNYSFTVSGYECHCNTNNTTGVSSGTYQFTQPWSHLYQNTRIIFTMIYSCL